MDLLFLISHFKIQTSVISPAMMSRSLFPPLLIGLSMSLTPVASSAETGFVDLFNGRDLTGWVPVNLSAETVQIEDGIITLSGQPKGMMRTQDQYQNFILELEWRHLSKGGNSGVMIWADGLPAVGAPYPRGIEVQILDHGQAERRPDRVNRVFTTHGDLFPIRGATMTPTGRVAPEGIRSFPRSSRSLPSPEWNHYRVECIDGRISLSVNGALVTTGENCTPRQGYICLESERGPVQFRNIRIKPLPGNALPPEQVADTAAGFAPLLNGQDATGWHVANEEDAFWSVVGNLVSSQKPTGRATASRSIKPDLWTDRAYRNFQLLVDWRLPVAPQSNLRPQFTADGLFARDAEGNVIRRHILDAGDSGIYLRGSSRYQVNLWSQPMGSGNVVALHKDESVPVAIRRAVMPSIKADKPLGEWNRFIITLVDDWLTVDLNGTTVLDHALLAGIPAAGPIALQYEYSSPAVEFTNIYLKELPD